MHLYLYRNIFVIKHTSWKMKAHETKSSFWTAFSLNDAFFQTSAWSEIRKHQKWDQRYPASQVTMATLSSLVTYCCLYRSTLHYTTSLNHWYNQDVSMLSRCLCQHLKSRTESFFPNFHHPILVWIVMSVSWALLLTSVVTSCYLIYCSLPI